MYKLMNPVLDYAWGSKQALTRLYGYANPQQKPMAEVWMGAHPRNSSRVSDGQGGQVALGEVIARDKIRTLGGAVARRFGELPFLFKVLCADSPLSVQVHPNKAAAVDGFARENAAGIALDAPQRNYKDDNHKPELVYAITPFLAMNGFRPLAEIAGELQPLARAHPLIDDFIRQPEESRLRALFGALLALEGGAQARALAALHEARAGQPGDSWQAIDFIARYFPQDNGLFAPLLLNVVTLQPGEAMFLYAQTPHAYLHGSALEVMANSDNVLRAGLTPKHIDIAELLASVDFVAKPKAQLLCTPCQRGRELCFPVPVDDFAFSLLALDEPGVTLTPRLAIVFCLQGQAQLRSGDQRLVLQPGESAFIAADDPPLRAGGRGRLACAYCELPA